MAGRSGATTTAGEMASPGATPPRSRLMAGAHHTLFLCGRTRPFPPDLPRSIPCFAGCYLISCLDHPADMIVESDQPLNRWLVQSTEQIIECRPATTIGHMNHVDPGHHVEQLAHQMCAASDTDRRHVELARIGLAIGDELGNRLSW